MAAVPVARYVASACIFFSGCQGGFDMQTELHPPRDIRYQCLMTVMAILLFLPELILMGLLPRMLEMFGGMGGELPFISQIFAASPLITFLFFLGLMISTIFFAWCNRKGAILASLSLLMQGVALGIHLFACLMPLVILVNTMGMQ